MDGNNWATIIVALIGLAGIVYQSYTAHSHKKDKEDQTREIKEAVSRVEQRADAAYEEAHKANGTLDEVKQQLSVNDAVTVTSVRQQIRRLYYERRNEKTISLTDYRALVEMYTSYKSVVLPDGHHPNSWCDALYEEMNKWERVSEYPEHLQTKGE